MEKLKRTAAVLDRLFTWAYRLILAVNILGGIFIGLFLLLCLSAPQLFDKVTDGFVTRLDFGGIAFQLAPGLAQNGQAGQIYFFSGLILGITALFLYGRMIRHVRAILAPMQEGLPFSQGVAESFGKLGWLAVVMGLLEQVTGFFLTGTLVRAYDIQALFLSPKITQVTVFSDFDFSFVFLALALFGLRYVFRYGTQLQQLSDETL